MGFWQAIGGWLVFSAGIGSLAGLFTVWAAEMSAAGHYELTGKQRVGWFVAGWLSITLTVGFVGALSMIANGIG